jgi:aminodeoxyfutalosine deaminase
VVGSPLSPHRVDALFASLPKSELHLHLEGSIAPGTAVELAARHGVSITEQEVAARYAPGNFVQFIEAFKWVTSFLRAPADYALIAERLAEYLVSQRIVYAEVTLSAGVMLFRKQNPLANFAAIRNAVRSFETCGLRVQWIFDCVRQFGPAAAEEVVSLAAQCVNEGVVAFGMGGDELALPANDFRAAYERAAACGLNCVAHAGEIGPAAAVRDAVEILGVQRIGHGIAAMHDPSLLELLAERGVALEICPTSNLRTGALAIQLGTSSPSQHQHPLLMLQRRGVPVTLSTDDPAMFETSLVSEYGIAATMDPSGVSLQELIRLAECGFTHAFLSSELKQRYLASVRDRAHE